MNEPKFPEIGSRFVPKDALPKGAPVRQVIGHLKLSDGDSVNAISSVPVKNCDSYDEFSKKIPLDDFNRNYKLV